MSAPKIDPKPVAIAMSSTFPAQGAPSQADQLERELTDLRTRRAQLVTREGFLSGAAVSFLDTRIRTIELELSSLKPPQPILDGFTPLANAARVAELKSQMAEEAAALKKMGDDAKAELQSGREFLLQVTRRP
jgi:hypothetical protein